MTLGEFFAQASQNSTAWILFFLSFPFCALINSILAKDRGAYSPWAYISMFLLYLTSFPAVFAVALNLYFFLIQKGDIMQLNLVFQVLPVVSLILTIFFIKRSVPIKFIPGLGSLNAIWSIMFASFSLMWLMDKIRIVIFTQLPFQYLLLIFAVIFVVIYFSWKKITS